ncbi:unnamed protein product [Porites evermanni]|uniref:Uncharacterized protein n=1 Tax=Porites evermanni TaxID=104178 RepID=A0ABN8RES7_9CNID|nr:unnamed protein product [Porites evermanni]
MKELKTKKLWEKVAERRGVSKSLVVKWKKDREKLRSQLALNKTKKNKGAARPTRQRRQLACGKVKAEKFPLAAECVVVEFKLRRAKGCKISKLWLKKKMKERLRHVTEKRQLRNSKLVTTGFRGSKSAITLLSGDDRTRKSLQPVTVRRQFRVSTEILEHPSKQQDGEIMLSWMVNMGVGYPKTVAWTRGKLLCTFAFGQRVNKTSSRVLYFGEKEMLVQKRKLNMMRGLTFTFKAVPGWTVILICNG